MDCRGTYLDTLRQLEGPRKLPETTLSYRVSTVLVLSRLLCLRRNNELVVLDLDLDIFFRESREFEGSCYEVFLGVFVEVHSGIQSYYYLCSVRKKPLGFALV